eukprot:gb/GECG01004986.1/.p1 GENE.gb/GECG01004986.1/~~gb/GECG01004986.1/.p1  ORF type:complete len:407 (+),score=23.51 gb/GECG01004986.1/:1-1221(+)
MTAASAVLRNRLVAADFRRSIQGHLRPFYSPITTRYSAYVPTSCGIRKWSSSTGTNTPRLRKGLGQHVLKDYATIKKIVDKANIQSADRVFELGPGTGNLTIHLLERAKKVYAVELDPAMCQATRERAQKLGYSDKLELVQANFLQVPFPKRFHAMVANIPYNITSPILHRVLTELGPTKVTRSDGEKKHVPAKRAILMVQKEFGDRMLASPGSRDYSRLSVNCRLFADVENLLHVPASLFTPPPKVDSTVLRVVPAGMSSHLPLDPGDPDDALLHSLWSRQDYKDMAISPTMSPNFDWEAWNYLLKICFGFKNKTLRASLTTKSVAARLLKTRAYNIRGVSQKSYEASRRSSASEFAADSVTVAQMQSTVSSLLNHIGLDGKRPNGMTEFEFRRLYLALEGLGCI